MLVYGDQDRTVDPNAELQSIRLRLEHVGRQPAGIERHAALVEAFMAAAGLAQGLADAEFEARGCDEVSPIQDAAMDLVMALARRVAVSWRSSFDQPGEGGAEEAARLAAVTPQSCVRIRRPEGYAFYAVYPEAWLEAAARLGWRGPRVIGLRSIGVGLAAMAAVATGSSRPVTLRPCGPPFRRELKLGPKLRAALLNGERFVVADEGPGLSGSSFGAVGDLLQAFGVEPERIAFLPSHAGGPGAEALERHRIRWAYARREVVGFEDLFVDAAGPAHRLATWFEDLAGPASAPLEDVSAGGWRRLRPDASAWPEQERRKFLLRTARGTWLLKFAGLGAPGREKLVRAQALAAAGFTPQPLGLRHGFLAERWLEAARPVDAWGSDRGRLLRTAGRYLGYRARAFPAEAGASPAEMAEMVRVNVGELLGSRAGGRLAQRLSGLVAAAGPPRPVMIDGRMHAWEWLRLPDGRVLKTDALDHAEAHDLIGPQDIAWDVAGAAVELDLGSDELAELCAGVEAEGARLDRRLLDAMLLAYAAFQAGLWSFAAEGALVARYAGWLERAGSRPVAARSA